MSKLECFNQSWVFCEGFDAANIAAPIEGHDVCLPHTAVALPFSYFDETCYQRAFTYQKVIEWRPEFENHEVAIVFDGAMADAAVYLNGEEIAAHKDGYTPFEARLTGKLKPGAAFDVENLMREALNEEMLRYMRLRLYDAGPPTGQGNSDSAGEKRTHEKKWTRSKTSES
jgi:hypothetical protein